MPYSTEYLKEMYAMYRRKSRKDIELEAMGEGETLARHHARLMDLAARHNSHPDQIVVYKERFPLIAWTQDLKCFAF